jgi:hypothetical protein
MTVDTSELTKVHLDLPNHWLHSGEALWAKPLGGDHYEIRNVPFCAYGLNWGDVVFAVAKAPELKPSVLSLVSQSGHRTLRVIFPKPYDVEAQSSKLSWIQASGAWLERFSTSMVCIDVEPNGDYDGICERLARLEAEGALEYETCEARMPGSFDDVAE